MAGDFCRRPNPSGSRWGCKLAADHYTPCDFGEKLNTHTQSSRLLPMPDEPTEQLKSSRQKLDTLHTLFGIVKNGTIRAIDWPQAKACLDYLEQEIAAEQANADALSPVEETNGKANED